MSIHENPCLIPILISSAIKLQLSSAGPFKIFVCFVALRPKSTAMVMARRSVHLTTLFSCAGMNKRLTSNSCTYFRL